MQETLDYLLDQCSNIPSDTLVIDQVISLDTENNHERKIRRLEGRLHRLSKTIRELEEKEMSLDEMAHCDLYEVESNLKEQACEVGISTKKFFVNSVLLALSKNCDIKKSIFIDRTHSSSTDYSQWFDAFLHSSSFRCIFSFRIGNRSFVD